MDLSAERFIQKKPPELLLLVMNSDRVLARQRTQRCAAGDRDGIVDPDFKLGWLWRERCMAMLGVEPGQVWGGCS